jgi:hypothetical protein
MTFREQLVKLKACNEAKEWVGDKTIEQAWKTCQNPHWMIWVLNKTDLDLIDPLCDIVESVLNKLDKETKQVCLNAISATKRRASEDELSAAANAIDDSGNSCIHLACSCLARYAQGRHASYAATVITYSASYVDGLFYDREKWGKKQCNIFRKYFTITQVQEALNKLVA